jgi:hypothetical protein
MGTQCETDEQIRVVTVGPVIVDREVGSEQRQSLAIDVIDHGGCEKSRRSASQIEDASCCGFRAHYRRQLYGFRHFISRLYFIPQQLGEVRSVVINYFVKLAAHSTVQPNLCLDKSSRSDVRARTKWHEQTDLAFGRTFSLGFRASGTTAMISGAELSNGHGDCSLGDISEVGEPSLIHLLLSASLVQFHNQVGLRGLKIPRRIVERGAFRRCPRQDQQVWIAIPSQRFATAFGSSSPFRRWCCVIPVLWWALNKYLRKLAGCVTGSRRILQMEEFDTAQSMSGGINSSKFKLTRQSPRDAPSFHPSMQCRELAACCPADFPTACLVSRI